MSPVDVAAGLVDQARRAGMRASEALVSWAEVVDVGLPAGGLPNVARSERVSASLRIWSAPGVYRVARGANPAELLDRAMASEPVSDPFDGPIATGAAVPLPGLLIEDRRRAALSIDDRIEMLGDMLTVARNADLSAEVTDAQLRDDRTLRGFATSRGIRLAEGATTFCAKMVVRSPVQGQSLVSRPEIRHRSLSTLLSFPFGAHAVRRLDGLRVPAGDGLPPNRSVFSTNATAALLTAIEPLFLRPELGSGFLAHSEFDARIVVFDDGSLAGGLRTRTFDDRGVPPGPVSLIRDGRADRFLLSPEAARTAVRSEPGHDTEGAVSVSNLVWASGVRTMNAILIEKARPTCWIDGFERLEVDLQTGVAEGVAHVESLVGNDARGAWIHADVRISLGDALKNVIDLAADTDRVGHIDSPAVWVEGVTVTPR